MSEQREGQEVAQGQLWGLLCLEMTGKRGAAKETEEWQDWRKIRNSGTWEARAEGVPGPLLVK